MGRTRRQTPQQKLIHVTGVSKEFRIGALVIAGLILLVLGVNYLKGFNLFSPSSTYHAHYEKIDGLAVSNPVLVNGYKVGQVTKIKFAPSGNGSLVVSFDIAESALQLTKDAKAKIISSDLFGTKAIDLIAGISEERALPGDTLLSDLEVGLADAVRIELIPLKNNRPAHRRCRRHPGKPEVGIRSGRHLGAANGFRKHPAHSREPGANFAQTGCHGR